jgi:hypothetical protein
MDDVGMPGKSGRTQTARHAPGACGTDPASRSVRGLLGTLTLLVAVVGCASDNGGSTTEPEQAVAAAPTTAQPATTKPTTAPETNPSELQSPPELQFGSATTSGGVGLDTIPVDQPGGSAIKVTVPCDSGTATLSAYPEGAGVEMTETLQDVAHRDWNGYAEITPHVYLERTPSGTTYSTRDGTLTITETNVPRHRANGVNYAWPQEAGWYYLSAKGGVPACGGRVYMGSIVYAKMRNISVSFVRSAATIFVNGWGEVPGETRHVRVDVTTPTGTQHKTRTVHLRRYGSCCGDSSTYDTQLSGFTNLDDVTRIVFTETDQAKRRTTWLSLTRTP